MAPGDPAAPADPLTRIAAPEDVLIGQTVPHCYSEYQSVATLDEPSLGAGATYCFQNLHLFLQLPNCPDQLPDILPKRLRAAAADRTLLDLGQLRRYVRQRILQAACRCVPDRSQSRTSCI